MTELICIVCPKGCHLKVDEENGYTVTGNGCPRGAAYGQKELTNPTRVITSTVRVEGGTLPVVSCKTRTDIPKGKIFDVARALKTVTVPAPVTIGQVLVDNVADTGVEIIATKNVGVKV